MLQCANCKYWYHLQCEGKIWYLIILAASKAVLFRIGICMDPYYFCLAGSGVGSRLATMTYSQGFGSGSGLDPYSIGPVDPDPYSESGSVFGIRIRIQEGKNYPQKQKKKTLKVHVLKCWMASFVELQASSVTWTYFMEAQGQVNCSFDQKNFFFLFQL